MQAGLNVAVTLHNVWHSACNHAAMLQRVSGQRNAVIPGVVAEHWCTGTNTSSSTSTSTSTSSSTSTSGTISANMGTKALGRAVALALRLVNVARKHWQGHGQRRCLGNACHYLLARRLASSIW